MLRILQKVRQLKSQIHKKPITVLFSAGPDSIFMVLQLRKTIPAKKLKLLLINYNRRNDSQIDVKFAKKFAKTHNLFLKIVTIPKTTSQYHHKNFQNIARKQRYFEAIKLCKKFNCKIIATGHNRDDFYETIYLQKQRQSHNQYFGISQYFLYQTNYLVYRPILKFSKKKIYK